jgi:site-specific DNA recombinase
MCVDYCLRHWIVQDKKLKAVGRDPLVIDETLIHARRLAATARPGDPHVADAHDCILDAERRVTEFDDELATLDGELVDEAEVAATLADFDALWDCLAPREQARVVELLVERVAYDGHAAKVA